MYDSLYKHLFSRIDAEQIHQLSVNLLAGAGQFAPACSILSNTFSPKTSCPPIKLWGKTFAHPLGLAGGFDKDARCLPALQSLGFSFIEVGTVTPQPQPGNPMPRLFRLTEDQALINRMGFPSAGAAVLAERLKSQPHVDVPLFISLGKNKATTLTDAVQDYIAVLNSLYPYGDAFVVNISSPNTPDLRKLQTREYLSDLLGQLAQTMKSFAGNASLKPLLVKIAPDLEWSEIDDILELSLQFGIAGIIATNTTLQRPQLKSTHQTETGGLSGQPLRQRSTEIIRYIHEHTEKKLTIIGVGGIFTGDDVWEKLSAGATLVQAYTGFIYKGPAFVKQALAQLEARMKQSGISHYEDIIGIK
ncbi:MAG: quinone-dependent dihydroorotate dehydrogenase [Anaerolineaceae bacterium]|nr:quinone-dependent dihydroorotate dehydrogenase [Anaerolineaceae bacterium]